MTWPSDFVIKLRVGMKKPEPTDWSLPESESELESLLSSDSEESEEESDEEESLFELLSEEFEDSDSGSANCFCCISCLDRFLRCSLKSSLHNIYIHIFI